MLRKRLTLIWVAIGLIGVENLYTLSVYGMGARSPRPQGTDEAAAYRAPKTGIAYRELGIRNPEGQTVQFRQNTSWVSCDKEASIQFMQESEGCRTQRCRQDWKTLTHQYSQQRDFIDYLDRIEHSTGQGIEFGRQFHCGYGGRPQFTAETEFAEQGFATIDTCVREAVSLIELSRAIENDQAQGFLNWLGDENRSLIESEQITIHHVGILAHKKNSFDRSTHAAARSIDIAGIRIGNRYFRYQPAHPCTHWGTPEVKAEWDSFWKPFFSCIKANGLNYVADDEPECRSPNAPSPSHSQVLHLCHPLSPKEKDLIPWMFSC